jgi:hypothetical protein
VDWAAAAELESKYSVCTIGLKAPVERSKYPRTRWELTGLASWLQHSWLERAQTITPAITFHTLILISSWFSHLDMREVILNRSGSFLEINGDCICLRPYWLSIGAMLWRCRILVNPMNSIAYVSWIKSAPHSRNANRLADEGTPERRPGAWASLSKLETSARLPPGDPGRTAWHLCCRWPFAVAGRSPWRRRPRTARAGTPSKTACNSLTANGLSEVVRFYVLLGIWEENFATSPTEAPWSR